MKKRLVFLFSILGVLALGICGCGSNQQTAETFTHRSASTPASDNDEEEEEETTEYLITELNMTDEYLIVEELGDDTPMRYSYSLTTRFLDKYGSSYSATHFVPGSVVLLGEVTATSVLSSVQMADDVWTYEGLSDYTIDTDRGIFTIGRSNYKITDNVFLYNGAEETSWDAIAEEDVLTVVGKDKEILSATITTGTGTIQLVNTDLFEGSLIFIGKTIITEVTKDMTITAPEGTYDVTVANDGYGGTASYTVTRGETTEIDLDTLKGEGPKTCVLTLQTDVEGATVLVDGKQIMAGTPVEVTYGTHSLVVTADGYDTWSRTLIVNSPSATISLELEESDSSSDDSSSSDTSSSSSSASSSSSDTDTSSSTSSTTDAEVDYLTTLTDMISSLLD